MTDNKKNVLIEIRHYRVRIDLSKTFIDYNIEVTDFIHASLLTLTINVVNIKTYGLKHPIGTTYTPSVRL